MFCIVTNIVRLHVIRVGLGLIRAFNVELYIITYVRSRLSLSVVLWLL